MKSSEENEKHSDYGVPPAANHHWSEGNFGNRIIS
jgi:hypothetical protein